MERAQKVLSQNIQKFLYHSVAKNNAELSQAEMYTLPDALSNMHWLNAKRGKKDTSTAYSFRLPMACEEKQILSQPDSLHYEKVLNSEALLQVLQEEYPAQLLNKCCFVGVSFKCYTIFKEICISETSGEKISFKK